MDHGNQSESVRAPIASIIEFQNKARSWSATLNIFCIQPQIKVKDQNTFQTEQQIGKFSDQNTFQETEQHIGANAQTDLDLTNRVANLFHSNTHNSS